jgi:fibronectin-binding autotransporter adhesin
VAENQSSSGLALMARAGRAVSRWSVGTAVAVGLAPVALAGPTGETVVIGDVTFTRDGSNVYITASDGSVIQYDSFNLSMDEIVTFFQPGSDARVYNQILSSMPSFIDGSIFANGIVYFVNPAGVIFGPSAVINVGGIYAAAASLSHADFIAGRDAFSNAQGAVVNSGSIVGSRIHLLGNQVQNHGSLRADGGLVMMAAGKDFLISEDGSGVMVHVDGRNAALGPSAGATTPGIGSQAGVLNTGWVDASGGSAILAAGDLYALGIHNLGTVTASGGNVQVTANDGLVLNDGMLDASALGDAGSVIVRGPTVVNRGEVRADSEHGQAGYAEVTSQNYTLLLGDSVVSAAGTSGNAQGGEVLIHSYEGYSELADESLLDVSGGDLGGDAGFVEFSGHWMNLYGTISLGAASGYDRGTLLIDPYDLDIVLDADLADNNKFTPNSPFDAQNGDLTIDVGEGKTNDGTTNEISVEEILALDGNIILEAKNNIRLLADLVFAPGPDTSLEMRAGNDIVITGDIGGLVALLLKADFNFAAPGSNGNGVGDVIWNDIATLTDIGTLTIDGVNVTLDQLDLTLTGGTADITARGDVSLLGQLGFATAGVLTVNADGNITLSSGVANATSVLLTADNDSNGAGDVTLPFTVDPGFTGAFTASGENIFLDDLLTSLSAQGLNLDGNIITAATTLTLDAGGGTLTLGDLTATAASSVVLIGDSLASSGSIAADVGTIDIQTTGAGLDTVGGSISSAGDFSASGDLSVTGSVSSGGGITGLGDLNAGGAMLGGGAIDITGAASAGADITAGTTLDIGAALTLTGGGAQTIEAGGQANFGGQVTKATGNLTLEAGLGGAGTLDFASGVEATAGTLSLLSDASVVGNLRSGADLTLDSGVTLVGGGNQTISSGGTLTIAQSINKATGDLGLEGETGVNVDAAITLSNGAFTSTGGFFDNTGIAISADSITLTHHDGVTIGGTLTAVTSIDLHAGDDGTGDLTIGGVALRGDSISLRAGNGAGGGALAKVDLLAGTTFAAADGVSGPGSLLFQQDASIDTATDGPTAVMIAGGSLGGTYTLTSGEGSVTIANGALAAGTDFTVNAATTISLNAALNANSFTTNSGGLTTIAGQVDTTGAITLNGTSSVQAAMTAGTTVDFGGNATVNAAVSATDAMTFQGTANVLTGLSTTGALTFQGAATIAANLSSGGAVAFESGAIFSGALDQSIAGTSIALDGGATKATGSLAANATTVSIGNQVTVSLGDFTSTGSVTTTDGIAASGAIGIGGDLAATSGTQVTVSGTSVTVAGNTSATSGGLLVDTGLFTTSDLNSTGGGDIALTGNGTINGNVGVSGQMDVTGALALNAAVLQTVTTTDGLTVGGAVTRTGGDLAVSGTLTLGGDVIGSHAVTLGDTVFSNDLADQLVDAAGTLTLNGTLSKADRTLSLRGSTIAGTSNSITVGGFGNLIVTGDTTLTGADVQAAEVVWFQSGADVKSVTSVNSSVFADAALTTTGNIQAVNGDVFVFGLLTAGANVTAGQSVFLSNGANVTGDLTATSGDVNVTGLLTAGAGVSAGQNVFLANGGDVTGDLTATNGDVNVTGLLTAGAGVSAGQNVFLANGGDVTGDINATSGDVNVTGLLTAGAGITAGQSVILANGGDVTGDINANGGNVIVSGLLTAGAGVTAGQSVILNNGGNVTGNITATLGSVDVSGLLTAGAGVTAGLNVILANGGDVTGDINATNGNVNVTGVLTAGAGVTAGQHVILANGGDVTGNITATLGNVDVTGLLTAGAGVTAGQHIVLRDGGTVAGTAQAGGVLFNAGSTTISGDAVFGSIDSDADLTIEGTATGGSIDGIATASLDIQGNVQLTGNLDAHGTTTLGANAQAAQLNFDTTLSLTGSGLQTLAATDITSGTITKTQGDLTVAGSNSTLFNSDVTVSGGSLLVSGPATLGIGVSQVQASQAVTFGQLLTVNSDTTFTAGNTQDLTFSGGIAAGGSTLNLESTGDTVFGATVTAAQVLTDAGGQTLVGGVVTTTGQQSYQDRVVLTADSSLTSTGLGGSLTLAQGAEGGFGLSTSADGTTAMGAGVDVGSWQTTTLGTTQTGSDVTTSGDLLIANILDLTNSVTFDGQNVSLTGGVNGSGQDLTINSGGVTELGGAVRLASLTTDNSGSFQLGANLLTESGVSIGESDVVLVADSSIRDADVGGLEIDNNFSGPFALLITSDGDLTVSGGTYTQITNLAFESAADILMQAQLGSVGSLLGSLSLQSGNLTLDPEDPGMIRFDNAGGAIDIFTTGNVTFNGSGRSIVPQVSTIGSTGDLTVDSTTGNFTMGQNEKLTVLGVLDVNLSFGAGFFTSATLGDITTLGDMIITADNIGLRARSGGVLLAENPNIPGLIEAGEDADNGVDFVTGGDFIWSVTPFVLGGGNSSVRFGSPGAAGDVNNRLGGFIQQDFGTLTDPKLLRSENSTIGDVSDDLFFDLASSGPTLTSVSEALAGALPRDTEVQEVPAETPLSMTELLRLRELNIYAQRPDPEEYLSNARIGVALYDDNDTLFAEIPEVTVNRLLNDRVREVLDGFGQLKDMSEEEATIAGTDDRRVLVKKQLTEARLEFALAASQGGESSSEAFHRFMAQGQYSGVIDFLGKLDELLVSVANLGLTDREFRTARRLTLEQIKPDNIRLDELERLLELSSGIQASPVDEAVVEPSQISLRD